MCYIAAQVFLFLFLFTFLGQHTATQVEKIKSRADAFGQANPITQGHPPQSFLLYVQRIHMKEARHMCPSSAQVTTPKGWPSACYVLKVQVVGRKRLYIFYILYEDNIPTNNN